MNYDKHFLETCEKLGKRIKYLREKSGLTIKEVSEKTGIRVEYLKKIEQGTAYGVQLEKHLIKIANTLNVKLSEMLKF